MVIAKCGRSRCSNIHRFRTRNGSMLCEPCRNEWVCFLLWRGLAMNYVQPTSPA